MRAIIGMVLTLFTVALLPAMVDAIAGSAIATAVVFAGLIVGFVACAPHIFDVRGVARERARRDHPTGPWR